VVAGLQRRFIIKQGVGYVAAGINPWAPLGHDRLDNIVFDRMYYASAFSDPGINPVLLPYHLGEQGAAHNRYDSGTS
jgi:hypothetical protein